MVKHGAPKSRANARRKDARVACAATPPGGKQSSLRETVNCSGNHTFIWEVIRVDIYRVIQQASFDRPYKVHELISARLKVEKQEQQRAAADQHADEVRRQEGGFFQRLFRRRMPALQSTRCENRHARTGLSRS
jgi:hypothetical protein